jgi:hypothetical protein
MMSSPNSKKPNCFLFVLKPFSAFLCLELYCVAKFLSSELGGNSPAIAPQSHELLGLILCMNMTGLRDAQLASKTLFVVITVKMFLEEIIV